MIILFGLSRREFCYFLQKGTGLIFCPSCMYEIEHVPRVIVLPFMLYTHASPIVYVVQTSYATITKPPSIELSSFSDKT